MEIKEPLIERLGCHGTNIFETLEAAKLTNTVHCGESFLVAYPKSFLCGSVGQPIDDKMTSHADLNGCRLNTKPSMMQIKFECFDREVCKRGRMQTWFAYRALQKERIYQQ